MIRLNEDIEIEIQKIKNFDQALRFRDACLPICYAQLRPLEVGLAAIVNNFAPLEQWGLVDSAIAAEKEIDELIWPAFEIMMKLYLPHLNSVYSLKETFNDIDLVYEAVHAQMNAEKVFEHCIRRKLSFIKDIAKVLNINLDWKELMTTAELAITKKLAEVKLRAMQSSETKSAAG